MIESVDLIIKADYLLTMNQDLAVIEDGAIAVKDGMIVAVDTALWVMQKYSASKIISGEGKVAFPGLINTHTHAAMVYFRGLADDLPLKVWLEEHVWPAEAKWLSPEFVSDAVELACLEMLKSGITTYADMYFFGDAVARSTRKIGMRAVVGSGVVDFPSATGSNADDYLTNAEMFIKKWRGDDLIVPSIADHSAYACCPDTLKKSKALADRLDVMLQIHLSETEWEVNEILSRYGRRPAAHLLSLGLLDERLIAAHCVWLDPDEITMMAESKTSVSHCIESNLKLVSGIAPIVKMLSAGVNVSFGTDGAASNNDLSILSEMSTAAKVHKTITGDPTALNAKQAMLMATRHGAEALGLGDKTGCLQEGKSADIVLADLRKPHMIPLYDIYSHIVYAMNSSDIDTVVVNGKIVLEGRTLVTADESEIVAKAVQWGHKIKRANSHS